VSFFRAIRRHFGVTLPLLAVYVLAVVIGSKGRVDGVVLSVLLMVVVLTIMTPVAISRLNRALLRGKWTPELLPGERVLHDGAADRYEFGYMGWLFLTDRRLLLYRVGGKADWTADLADVTEVRVGMASFIMAADILIELRGAKPVRLNVEAPREWVQWISEALPAAR
jgi:hypothetical protein